MLFAIDAEKVQKEMMAASTSKGGYKVTTSEIAATPEELSASLYSATLVSGTDYDVSAISTETRRQLMAIRRRIEESGEPLKSVDELSAEIAARRSGTR